MSHLVPITWNPFTLAEPYLNAEQLGAPIEWSTPSRVVVAPSRDLFTYSRESIAAAFGVMAACFQHQFVIRTAYEDEREEWFRWISSRAVRCIGYYIGDMADSVINSEDGELSSLIANYVNGWSSWATKPDNNPCNGTVPRWPLPNVTIEVVL